MAYRAVRTENKVAVGEWTKDLSKGQVLPTDQVPDYVADYLLQNDVIIEVPDDASDNPWFDSEDPDLADVGAGSVKKNNKA